MDKQVSIIERYRNKVYRSGWRLQYHVKKMRTSECTLFEKSRENTCFSNELETRILVQQLLHSLPVQGRRVLYKLYILNMTEAEVAKQLKMSQQAVNKWKRKMLQQLSQSVNF